MKIPKVPKILESDFEFFKELSEYSLKMSRFFEEIHKNDHFRKSIVSG